MEQSRITFRSSIHRALKKSVLLRGTIWASIGVLLWVLAGVFLPLSVLTIWGAPILLLGGALIVVGLLPYRRLSRQENKPNELILTELDELYIFFERTGMFKVELKNIETMAYLDDDTRYGIGLWIKYPKKSHITLLNPHIKIDEYLKNCQKDYQCDIFLPYFSKRTYQEIEEIYKQ